MKSFLDGDIKRRGFAKVYIKQKISVRPNTEYSAEYSAKIDRIFGTEHSAELAEYRISKIGQKMKKNDVFHVIFGHFFALKQIITYF